MTEPACMRVSALTERWHWTTFGFDEENHSMLLNPAVQPYGAITTAIPSNTEGQTPIVGAELPQ